MFAMYGLPPPRIAIKAHSALSIFISLTYSDLLLMAPRQWTEIPFTSTAMQEIYVVERLPAPSIHIVRRLDIPMTPAAEYFCDLIRRAGASISHSASTGSSNRVGRDGLAKNLPPRPPAARSTTPLSRRAAAKNRSA
jgi:hypothetical protein